MNTSKKCFTKLIYFIRNIRSKALFEALRLHCSGDVLDVGGWDFFETIVNKKISFNRWVVLENDKNHLPSFTHPRAEVIHGDGLHISFQNETFDTVLSIQVLEHVFEPFEMMKEMTRVLKKNCFLIILAPQTSTIHLAPNHYQNFTRFWFLQAIRSLPLELISIKPLGGFWSTIASRCFYFFSLAGRFSGMTYQEIKRPVWFYFLFPFMALIAIFLIPLCLILSLGDLEEEPNNHLIVARKK